MTATIDKIPVTQNQIYKNNTQAAATTKNLLSS